VRGRGRSAAFGTRRMHELRVMRRRRFSQHMLKAHFDRPLEPRQLITVRLRRGCACCNPHSSPCGPALVQPLAQRST